MGLNDEHSFWYFFDHRHSSLGFYYLHNCEYMADQITEDFEQWAPLLLHLVKCNRLKQENEQLRNQIKHLESQVYGGSTK
jgi:hypothetical protein